MEYYILLATLGLSLVSYTLGLDLLWWLIIFECTSNVNIAICLCARNAIHRGLTLHYIIGVSKIGYSEVYNKAFATPARCDDGIRSFCVDRIRRAAIWWWAPKCGLHISDSRISWSSIAHVHTTPRAERTASAHKLAVAKRLLKLTVPYLLKCVSKSLLPHVHEKSCLRYLYSPEGGRGARQPRM